MGSVESDVSAQAKSIEDANFVTPRTSAGLSNVAPGSDKISRLGIHPVSKNTTQTAVQEGILIVRDFAFSNDDNRHSGFGSVIPIEKEDELPTFVALYDFVAESDNELSVSAGTPVHVIREVAGGWMLAQTIDDLQRRGLVPCTYLQSMDCS